MPILVLEQRVVVGVRVEGRVTIDQIDRVVVTLTARDDEVVPVVEEVGARRGTPWRRGNQAHETTRSCWSSYRVSGRGALGCACRAAVPGTEACIWAAVIGRHRLEGTGRSFVCFPAVVVLGRHGPGARGYSSHIFLRDDGAAVEGGGGCSPQVGGRRPGGEYEGGMMIGTGAWRCGTEDGRTVSAGRGAFGGIDAGWGAIRSA